jgi:ubiquinone/menaquinone biosynthesis C-methylase UbiE
MASLKTISKQQPLEDRAAVLCVSDVSPGRPARFDRIARLYRTMEYLSFGPFLERCRSHHIPTVLGARSALILGDGDGRFLARLMAAAPHLQADAVDASSAMLHLLRNRLGRQGDLHRLTTTCADARIFSAPSSGYDLVVTHFFLDCLTEAEAGRLISGVRPHLAPGARWLISEFQVPRSGVFHQAAARSVISGLYAAFGLLTGLTVRQIPAWRLILARNGFAPQATHSSLGGLLVSELWELPSRRQPRIVPRAST